MVRTDRPTMTIAVDLGRKAKKKKKKKIWDIITSTDKYFPRD